MTVDPSCEFEKRRNVPVKYDRELMDTTVKAMRRIAEVKAKRERVFFRERVAKGRLHEQQSVAQEAVQHRKDVQLLKAPTMRRRQQERTAVVKASAKMDVESA